MDINGQDPGVDRNDGKYYGNGILKMLTRMDKNEKKWA
jgi:hypothetical protein